MVVRVLLRGFATEVAELEIAGRGIIIVGPADAKKWPRDKFREGDREGVTWCSPLEAGDIEVALRRVSTVIDVAVEIAE